MTHDVDVDEPRRCAVNPHHTLRPDELGTCLPCRARTRTLILEIVEALDVLPDAVRTLVGLSYDTGNRDRDDAPIVGGDAVVMLGPGTTGTVVWRACPPGCNHTTCGRTAHLADQYPTDPPSITAVLTGIEDDWRRFLHHRAATGTDARAAAGYLLHHLAQAAQAYPLFSENHHDLTALHHRARAVAGTTDDPVPMPAPCLHCGGRIIRRWRETGLDDLATCEDCGTAWAADTEYRVATRGAVYDAVLTRPDALVTLDEAKAALKVHGIKPHRVDVWANRGLLVPARRSPTGLPTHYRLGDLTDRAGLTRKDTPA